jgi:hypothetical protein
MDSSGKIDLFPYIPSYENDVPEFSLPRVELIDLQTGKSLTSVVAYQYLVSEGLPDWAALSTIEPLGDRKFLSIGCYYEACGGRVYQKARIIDISTGTLVEGNLIDNAIALAPDRKHLLIWSQALIDLATRQPTEKVGINLYNMETNTVTPLIQKLPIELYDLGLSTYYGNLEAPPSLQVNIIAKFELPENTPNFRTFNMIFGAEAAPFVEVRIPPETRFEQLVCVLTTQTGVNLRIGAGGNLERFGTAEAGERLIAVDQSVSSNDGLLWYQLEQGGWVREDFVSKTSGCNSVSSSTSDTLSPISTLASPTEVTPIHSPVDCELITRQGVNFRAQPSIEAEKIGSALAETVFQADGQSVGTDGFVWWRLVDAQGWVREDLVSESEGCTALPFIQ